jgi:hypothetical protein
MVGDGGMDDALIVERNHQDDTDTIEVDGCAPRADRA